MFYNPELGGPDRARAGAAALPVRGSRAGVLCAVRARPAFAWVLVLQYSRRVQEFFQRAFRGSGMGGRYAENQITVRFTKQDLIWIRTLEVLYCRNMQE